MRSVTYISPDKERDEVDNKFNCNILDCPEKATGHLDLPFGEYGSTLLFLCKNCKDVIENMENNQIG